MNNFIQSEKERDEIEDPGVNWRVGDEIDDSYFDEYYCSVKIHAIHLMVQGVFVLVVLYALCHFVLKLV